MTNHLLPVCVLTTKEGDTIATITLKSWEGALFPSLQTDPHQRYTPKTWSGHPFTPHYIDALESFKGKTIYLEVDSYLKHRSPIVLDSVTRKKRTIAFTFHVEHRETKGYSDNGRGGSKTLWQSFQTALSTFFVRANRQ